MNTPLKSLAILGAVSAMPCSDIKIYIYNEGNKDCGNDDFNEEQTNLAQPAFDNAILSETNNCKDKSTPDTVQSEQTTCSEESYTTTVFTTNNCQGQGTPESIKWNTCTASQMAG